MKTGGYLVPASMARDFEWMVKDPEGWAIERERREVEENKLPNLTRRVLRALKYRLTGLWDE